MSSTTTEGPSTVVTTENTTTTEEQPELPNTGTKADGLWVAVMTFVAGLSMAFLAKKNTQA